MELYIGGYAQHKLQYVLRERTQEQMPVQPENEIKIQDGGTEDFETTEAADIYNHLHLWIRRKLAEGKCPEALLEEIVSNHPECAIVCDEIGNGIVPADASEREYRERTGRILCELASKASRVERILCGIGWRIK